MTTPDEDTWDDWDRSPIPLRLVDVLTFAFFVAVVAAVIVAGVWLFGVAR